MNKREAKTEEKLRVMTDKFNDKKKLSEDLGIDIRTMKEAKKR